MSLKSACCKRPVNLNVMTLRREEGSVKVRMKPLLSRDGVIDLMFRD